MVSYMDNETLKKYGYKLIKKNDPFWVKKTKGVKMSSYHFQIILKTGLKNAKLLAPRMGEAGLDVIDEIRQTCNVPDISIDNMNIDMSCNYYSGNEYVITMSETGARKIPQFRGSNKINIIIPGEYLTKYYVMRFKKRMFPKKSNCDYNIFRLVLDSIGIWKIKYKDYFESTSIDNIEECYIDTLFVWFDIDDTSLIDDWIADGCPTYWHITEVKHKRLKFIEDTSDGNEDFCRLHNKSGFISMINKINIEDTSEFNKVIEKCIKPESIRHIKNKVGLV